VAEHAATTGLLHELAADARDLALFDERANEPTVDFEDFVKGLKRDGTI